MPPTLPCQMAPDAPGLPADDLAGLPADDLAGLPAKRLRAPGLHLPAPMVDAVRPRAAVWKLHRTQARMMAAALALFGLIAPVAARAACTGTDLLAQPDAFGDLAAKTDAQPYATGNHWLATSNDTRIHVIGTFHVNEPRLADRMPQLGPVIDAADLLLVEAGPDEMAALTREVMSDPALMFITEGPTMIDLLGDADWTILAGEMAARGIPGFFAAKFKPWYVTVLLGMPACALAGIGTELGATPQGLDQMLIDRAAASDVPVRGLEPYDTVFRIFGRMTQDQQLDMVRASLPMASGTTDSFVTLTEAYFREQHRLTWEFSRAQALSLSGAPQAETETQFALLEDALLTSRNRAWIDVILPQAALGQTIVVAVGAAHLSGPDGLLPLLAARGFALERQPF